MVSAYPMRRPITHTVTNSEAMGEEKMLEQSLRNALLRMKNADRDIFDIAKNTSFNKARVP